MRDWNFTSRLDLARIMTSQYTLAEGDERHTNTSKFRERLAKSGKLPQSVFFPHHNFVFFVALRVHSFVLTNSTPPSPAVSQGVGVSAHRDRNWSYSIGQSGYEWFSSGFT